MKALKNNGLIKKIYDFFKMFFDHNLTSAAAEMAYFLIFAFFPLLMVVFASISMATHELELENSFFYYLIPDTIEDLIDSYIRHIGENSTISYLLIGIVLTLFTLSKFMTSLKRTIREIYHSHNYTFPFAEVVMSVIFSVLIISAFYVSLFVLVVGEQILRFIELHFDTVINIVKLKSLSKLLFIGIVIYSIISLFYFWIPNVKQKAKDIFPGTLFASLGWVIVSGLFSFYMNHFSNYSLIYGSIGAFIMLMLWIYMSCLIILAGAVINAMIYSKKYKKQKITKE